MWAGQREKSAQLGNMPLRMRRGIRKHHESTSWWIAVFCGGKLANTSGSLGLFLFAVRITLSAGARNSCDSKIRSTRVHEGWGLAGWIWRSATSFSPCEANSHLGCSKPERLNWSGAIFPRMIFDDLWFLVLSNVAQYVAICYVMLCHVSCAMSWLVAMSQLLPCPLSHWGPERDTSNRLYVGHLGEKHRHAAENANVKKETKTTLLLKGWRPVWKLSWAM